MDTNVLVMIPAHEEENTIGEVVKAVRELYPDFDILVINDGSEDETERRARKAGATVIALPFHAGGTVAVLTGYLVALYGDYNYLVKIDGDGQHRPQDIGRVLEPVVSGRTDICVGSRYLMNKNENKAEDDSMVKTGGRIFSSALISALVEGKITDVTSGLRAWNRKALHILTYIYLNRKLPDDSILWPVETIIASKSGLKIMEVPIEVLPRRHGKSKSYSLLKMANYPFRLARLLIEVMVK